MEYLPKGAPIKLKGRLSASHFARDQDVMPKHRCAVEIHGLARSGGAFGKIQMRIRLRAHRQLQQRQVMPPIQCDQADRMPTERGRAHLQPGCVVRGQHVRGHHHTPVHVHDTAGPGHAAIHQ